MKRIFFTLIALFCLSTYASAQEGAAVIAVVSGNDVTHSDIKQKDSEEVPDEELHNAELRSLYLVSYKIIIPKLVLKYDIKVSDKDVEQKINDESDGLDIKSTVQQLRERYSSILRALESVDSKEKSLDAAYSLYLKDVITLENWKSFANTYEKPSSREWLKSMSNLTEKEFRKSLEASIIEVLEEKELYKEVDILLSQADDKFANELANRKMVNGRAVVSPYVAEKRKEWWLKVFKSEIDVKDSKFSDFFEYINDKFL